jgi:prepilin-type N-terminal cleavage/methylation domain-containing protein
MKTALKRSGGFTLIEVMMVVAILGLALTMGFPSFTHAWKQEGIGKAERDLIQACQEARRASIMNNKTTDLVIRPLDRTISVPGGFGPAVIPSDVNIDILGVNFIQMETFDEAHVHFFPGGTSDEFTIVLHAADGLARKYSLDTVTALVRIENIR